MIEVALSVGALIAAIYTSIFLVARLRWYDQGDLLQLFHELENIASGRTYRLVFRFEGSSYWLLLERKPPDDKQEFTLCIPRPGFVDDDYGKLEEMFVEHGFRFTRGDDFSRFAARVSIADSSQPMNPSTAAALAVRLFMRALGIAPTTRFRRSTDMDAQT